MGTFLVGPTLGPLFDPLLGPIWTELKRQLPPGLDGSGITTVFGLHTTAELGAAAGFVLWAFTLALPLPGIDRRDDITGLLYVCWMLFAGVTLVLALPTTGAAELSLSQVVLMLLMAAAAGTKWSFRRSARDRAKEKDVTATTKTTTTVAGVAGMPAKEMNE